MTALMATNLSRAAESGAAQKANCLEKSLAVDFQKVKNTESESDCHPSSAFHSLSRNFSNLKFGLYLKTFNAVKTGRRVTYF